MNGCRLHSRSFASIGESLSWTTVSNHAGGFAWRRGFVHLSRVAARCEPSVGAAPGYVRCPGWSLRFEPLFAIGGWVSAGRVLSVLVAEAGRKAWPDDSSSCAAAPAPVWDGM